MVVDGDSLFWSIATACCGSMPRPAPGSAASPGRNPPARSSGSPAPTASLAALSGDTDVVTPISFQTIADNPIGRALAVYDAMSGSLLWQDALAGQRRRATDHHSRQAAFTAWCKGWDWFAGSCPRERPSGRTPTPQLQADFRTPASEAIRELLVSQPILLATDDVLLLKAKWVKNTAALSARRRQAALEEAHGARVVPR